MKNSAPSKLSAEARRWWRRLVAEYDINDDAGRLLLQMALEAFDEMRAAQKVLDAEGPTTKDRWGQTKVNPAAAVARDARSGMLQALRALNLDLEPLRDRAGRPGGS